MLPSDAAGEHSRWRLWDGAAPALSAGADARVRDTLPSGTGVRCNRMPLDGILQSPGAGSGNPRAQTRFRTASRRRGYGGTRPRWARQADQPRRLGRVGRPRICVGALAPEGRAPERSRTRSWRRDAGGAPLCCRFPALAAPRRYAARCPSPVRASMGGKRGMMCTRPHACTHSAFCSTHVQVRMRGFNSPPFHMAAAKGLVLFRAA